MRTITSLASENTETLGLSFDFDDSIMTSKVYSSTLVSLLKQSIRKDRLGIHTVTPEVMHESLKGGVSRISERLVTLEVTDDNNISGPLMATQLGSPMDERRKTDWVSDENNIPSRPLSFPQELLETRLSAQESASLSRCIGRPQTSHGHGTLIEYNPRAATRKRSSSSPPDLSGSPLEGRPRSLWYHPHKERTGLPWPISEEEDTEGQTIIMTFTQIGCLVDQYTEAVYVAKTRATLERTSDDSRTAMIAFRHHLIVEMINEIVMPRCWRYDDFT